MGCFWLSILPIPCYIIDKIYTMCRKFVWNCAHPPIAWSTCYKDKSDGGLGLKDLRVWNKALLVRSLWNIQSKKDTLWVKWINCRYGSSIWGWTTRKDDSNLFKKLILIRDEIVRIAGSNFVAQNLLEKWFNSNKAGVHEA
ncbi:hypothetical protein F511_32557 [Dorcoceras hygrometricum]|uniref:Uncharacterized protein n=1 Tax=Dorcoceras hygrometricum TaxID=472368 RepID=A0A2Z7D089_9LAMI|nr:hypothetical protein F511_32557 [Dorcoceras hygrometricum]